VADSEKALQREGDGDKAKMVVSDYRVGRADQEPWKSEVWQRISEYVIPRKSEINTKKTKSIDGYTDNVYDTTAIHANTTLAAGQMDFLVGGNWFENEAPFDDASDEAKLWYKKTGEKMRDVINASNFDMEVHSFFVMRGGFGTSHFHVEEDEEKVIACKSEDIGDYIIFENARGIVDKVIVIKEYTPRQIMQMYGTVGEKGNRGVPQNIVEMAEQTNKDQKDNKIQVLIWVGPREDTKRDSRKLDAANMPVMTLHVVLDSSDANKEGTLLRESGFEEMPTMVSRFAEWGNEVYGYCPSVEVLPLILQLNVIEQNQDMLAELMVNPRLLLPDNMEGDVSLRAGGVTIYDSSTPTAKPEEWATSGRYDIGQDRLNFKRSQVDQAYFVDLKVGRFHPTFTRFNSEFSEPFLNRVFSICFRAGLFPDPPEDVIRQNNLGEDVIETPKVKFTGKMAMLMKARENNDFMAFLRMSMPLFEQDPSAFQRTINVERSVEKLADNQGVHTDFFNTPEEREAIEVQQNEQAARQQQLEAASTMAKAAGDLGRAPEGVQQAIDI